MFICSENAYESTQKYILEFANIYNNFNKYYVSGREIDFYVWNHQLAS